MVLGDRIHEWVARTRVLNKEARARQTRAAKVTHGREDHDGDDGAHGSSAEHSRAKGQDLLIIPLVAGALMSLMIDAIHISCGCGETNQRKKKM